MEFDSIIKRRHSAREFKNKGVSWKLILDAVDAAIKGPFAGNNNNLKFIIIEEEEKIQKISKFSNQTWINEASIVVIICSDDTFLEKQYGERGRVYSRQQAGAAISTFILKLADLGLDSCWIGAFTDELVKTALKIPEHIQIEAIIPIGYEDTSKIRHPRKDKVELEHVLRWEDYETKKRPSAFPDPNVMRRNAY